MEKEGPGCGTIMSERATVNSVESRMTTHRLVRHFQIIERPMIISWKPLGRRRLWGSCRLAART